MKSFDDSSSKRALIGQTPYAETLRLMEQFFCSAMLEGYPTNDPSHSIRPHRNIDGWEEYNYTEAPFLLLDEWCEFTGRTWISLIGGFGETAAPVWVMHYEGFYEKEVIFFLKQALSKQYAEGFLGGRGPKEFTDVKHPDLTYTNNTQGTFRQFTADDKIINSLKGEVMGRHSCWGGMLI